MERALPTGTVTFLFTDVEGSTRLLEQLGVDAYGEALAEHRRALRQAFAQHSGVEVDTQGDAFFVAFPTAPDGLRSAVEAQQALAGGPIRVRMGIHTGTPALTEEGYVGPDVHRAARIAAAGSGGQVLVSASAASLLGHEGLRDLGEHRLKDLSAPERIYQVGADEFPPLKSLERTNLPVPATPFLGRERELEEVTALLESEDARLLTLTGPAGAGKTRLALQAAAGASERFPDGVYWAPLASLRDKDLVLEVAAQALGARNGLTERIADRRLLLLLDNFEHLIDAAADLAELLASCPNLQLLVTSRELLRIPGEQAYSVQPLEPGDATELFTARARAVDPGFTPGPAVQELCSRLDNLPLALELAAARVQVLSLEQLLDRLSQRLDLLKAGRGADPRQQTLRATIEWSYELLEEPERLLFERLSVFRGGCPLEAAEAVCDADVDGLQSLVDKSLLRRAGGRFWMLESIRQYADEHSDEPARGALADRHAGYFLSLAEELAANAPDEDPEQARELYVELDNVRSALAWLQASGDVIREARLATAAFWCLWTRGSLGELKEWLRSALEQMGGDIDSALRADVLGAAALAAANTGEREPARKYATESLALARERDDKRQIEWALRVLSFDERDLEKRRELLAECERLLRELGSAGGLGWVMYLRGMTFIEEARFAEARRSLEEAAAIFSGGGRRWEATNAEVAVAHTLTEEGLQEEARPIIEKALRAAVDLQSALLAVDALVIVSGIRVQSHPVAAVRMLSASRTLAEENGWHAQDLYYGPVAERAEAAAREQLGDGFEAEWEAGRLLSLERAVALALS